MPANSWGRWGPEDEAGALNLIGPAQVVRSAGLVSEGRVIRLGQDLGPGTPMAPHRERPEPGTNFPVHQPIVGGTAGPVSPIAVL